MHSTRQQLRQQMRQRRRSLSRIQQYLAAQRLAQHLRHYAPLQRAKRVGLYVGHQGELDPWRCANQWRAGKQVYLPVLAPNQRQQLLFVSPHSNWKRNRYGIIEPTLVPAFTRPLWQLDLLLVPLVAFDRQGGRLGMGGGYYDRTLASVPSWAKHPVCVGVAYRFQECNTLPLADWDWPMDDVVTD